MKTDVPLPTNFRTCPKFSTAKKILAATLRVAHNIMRSGDSAPNILMPRVDNEWIIICH